MPSDGPLVTPWCLWTSSGVELWPHVGIGLVGGALDYWVQMGHDGCPLILLSTHFHRLPSFLPSSPLLEYAHMALEQEASGTLRYLYRLYPGPSDYSYAADTALANGLPQNVVARGLEVYQCYKDGVGIRYERTM